MSFTLGQIMPEAWRALHIHVANGERIRIKKEKAFRMDELKRRGLIRHRVSREVTLNRPVK